MSHKKAYLKWTGGGPIKVHGTQGGTFQGGQTKLVDESFAKMLEKERGWKILSSKEYKEEKKANEALKKSKGKEVKDGAKS